jgi:hypothetical protein
MTAFVITMVVLMLIGAGATSSKEDKDGSDFLGILAQVGLAIWGLVLVIP